MKFLAGMSVLAAAVNAASVGLNKRDSPLDVKIEVVDNTAVKASITNSGAEDLRLFNQGNILDNKAVKKADVFTGSEKVKFDGLRLRVTHENLDDSAFQTIAAGKTVELTFDLAEVHDFSAGGAFDISSKGKLAYAAADSNAIAGHLDYESNLIHAEVDGSKAKSSNDAFKSAHSNVLSRRTNVQSDCTGSRGSATRQAIQNCESLASAAASAARSGSASRISEYFGSSSSSVRSQVASVLSRSASECSSTSSGNSDQYCTDVLSSCQSGVLAYTYPAYAIMVNCPLYYNYLPAVARQCHAQDQATTTLHETTHLTSVAGTDDLGYGYSAATSLSTRDALNNADSYALFANAVYLNC